MPDHPGRLEGKWKLNQNQSPLRRERVARMLEASPRPGDREVAALMRQREPRTVR